MEHKNENLKFSQGFCWAGFQLERFQLTQLETIVVEEPDFAAKLAFTDLHKAWPNMTALDNEEWRG